MHALARVKRARVTDPESLPLPQRLALAYAPASTRDQWGALLAFDHRVASAMAQAREPLLRQMRLAWWRDMLHAPTSVDPLRSALEHQFPGRVAALAAAVDGWEELTAPAPLPIEALDRYARGRAAPFMLLSPHASGHEAAAISAAARCWALGDFIVHASNPDERQAARRCIEAQAAPGRLARAFRPLAVLSALSQRAAQTGRASLLDDRGAALLAMRVGIFGR